MKKYFTCLIAILSAALPLSGQYVWTEMSSMPIARYIGAGFVIGKYSYVGTGYNSIPTALSDWWKYDPVADTWTQVASNSAGRASAFSFEIMGKGYVGLGARTNILTDMYEYDPVLNSWTQKATFPGTARFGGASFVLGTEGFVCCGNMGTASGPYTNQMYAFNAVTNTWTQKTSLPAGARYGCRGTAINNLGYVFGGMAGTGGSNSTYYTDLWEYNANTNGWTQKTDIPGIGRNYASVLSLGGKLIVGNGVDWSGFREDFYEYDPATNSWGNVPPMPNNEARWSAVTFTIGMDGYVVSGNQSMNNPIVITDNLWKLSLTTGIENAGSADFKIYPSLATENISINFTNSISQNLKATVVNQQGQICKVITIPQNTGSAILNVSELKAGVYFTQVTNDSGEKLSTQKFTKINY